MRTPVKKIETFSFLLLSCLLFRLLPWRAPNIEPLTASLLPLNATYGRAYGVFFVIFSVVVYDLLTATVGIHTFFTLTAFLMLALWSSSYFSKNKATTSNYIRFVIPSTLFFDAVTGLIPGPVFFGQSLSAALVGQIPFTALHLAGNVVFAATLSPAIYYLLSRQRPKPAPEMIINTFNPNVI